MKIRPALPVVANSGMQVGPKSFFGFLIYQHRRCFSFPSKAFFLFYQLEHRSRYFIENAQHSRKTKRCSEPGPGLLFRRAGSSFARGDAEDGGLEEDGAGAGQGARARSSFDRAVSYSKSSFLPGHASERCGKTSFLPKQVDEVIDLMKSNVEKVLERDEGRKRVTFFTISVQLK